MTTHGRLMSVTQNIITGKLNVTFEIDTKPSFDELNGIDLDIEAKKHRKKRSLDANAYFHVLVGKIASCFGDSNAKVKNMLIARYGQPEIMDDGSILYYKTNAPVEYMANLESIHSIPVKYDGNAVYYKIMRGSHTYDSKEMSTLINGTVEEAKTLGIETETPAEIERMVALWGRRNQSSQQTWNDASYAEDLM